MTSAPPDAILMTARECAASLRISTRTLWALTQAGTVPHVRLGHRVLYPADRIRAAIADMTSPALNEGAD